MRNESKSLERLYKEIEQFSISFKNQPKFSGIGLEFIFVDNCSEDDTSEQLVSKFAGVEDFKVLRHVFNRGLQRSIMTGLRHATGDAVVVLQSDLQDPISLVTAMVERWLAGEKYVATKIDRRNSSFLDRYLRSFGYFILRLVSQANVLSNSSDFWLIDRRLVKQIQLHSVKRPFIRTLLPKLRKPDSILIYDREKRHSGESNFNLYLKYEFFVDALLADPRRLIMATVLSSLGLVLIFIPYLLMELASTFSSHIVNVNSFIARNFGGVISGAKFFMAIATFLMISLLLEIAWRIYADADAQEEDLVQHWSSTDQSEYSCRQLNCFTES